MHTKVLMGVVALMGQQNIGKTTEIKHFCLDVLRRGLATCVVPQNAPLKRLVSVKGEANLVLLYRGKRIGVRGAGDATRYIKDNFRYFEKENCEYGITAVRIAETDVKMSAAESAFDVAVRTRTVSVKRICKTSQGDCEIQKILDALDDLIDNA